ncbi:serine/threonine protein kinase [Bifidobacterium samirii]|uniref:non-specific serine/threonine protein kinase n=1 Tax=Bifidobacterium samirii TaxID=2306974 RepID=A0A430FUP3_9BIFI|nr:serine/threonine-protein kinase [Bifidobacterium samirii]RSX57187.1 serine/threonine protein kinase [Bifidobacterium samirii]
MDDTQVMHAMALDDAYHVIRTLASGPQGVTELVDFDGAGPFVRKKMPLELTRRRLWSTLAECRSPRLPRVESTYELPDAFVVVYDYVAGDTLDALVAAHGPMDEAGAVRTVRQLCEAAGELHAHGIVHRDITPANIVMAADGVHLIDFGIARERGGAKPVARDTVPLGTYGFAAPEQFGFAPSDARSDLYAIGRVLGYLLTGVRPDDQRSYDERLAATPMSLRTRRVIGVACAFEPSARYADAAAFLRALDGDGSVGGAGMDDAASTGVGTGAGDGVPGGPGAGVSDGPGSADAGVSGADGAVNRVRESVAAAAGRASGIVPTLSRIRVPGWLVAALLVAAVAVGYLLPGGPSWTTDGSVSGTAGSAAGASRGNGSSSGKPSGSSSDGGSSAGTSAAGATDATTFVDESVELVESGWRSERGYVTYVVCLRNNDAGHAVKYLTIHAVARKADGSVLFSDDHTIGGLYAGQTRYEAMTFGDGSSDPATVDFEIGASSVSSVIASDAVESYEVSGTISHTDGFGGVTFTGEATLRSSGDDLLGTSGGKAVLVLRDRAGNIVYGDSTYFDRPAMGKARSVTLTVYPDGIDYDSYEMYAYDW